MCIAMHAILYQFGLFLETIYDLMRVITVTLLISRLECISNLHFYGTVSTFTITNNVYSVLTKRASINHVHMERGLGLFKCQLYKIIQMLGKGVEKIIRLVHMIYGSPRKTNEIFQKEQQYVYFWTSYFTLLLIIQSDISGNNNS